MGTNAETTTTAVTVTELAMTTVVGTTAIIVVATTLGIVMQWTGPNPSQRTKLWKGNPTKYIPHCHCNFFPKILKVKNDFTKN